MNRISRLTVTALLVGLMVVVIATPAQAKRFHVTGQQTVITPSAQFTSFLTSHNITVTAVAPATLANGSLTLPIVRGHVATPSLRGKLVHAGAVQLSNGTRTVTLRHFVLTRSHGHAPTECILHGARAERS